MAAWRRATILALASSCAAAVLLAAPARADSCGAPLLSTCINDDNFWPHAGPSQFMAIGGTETVAKGQIGIGLVTSYLSRPVTLQLPSPGPNGSTANAIDNQANGTFLWSYGLTNRLELDAALPITFAQNGGGTSPITGASSQTAIQTTAVRDLRFGFAYSLLPRPRVDPRARPNVDASGAPLPRPSYPMFGLTARLEMSAPTGDQNQFAGESSAVYIPSVAADFRRNRIFAGAEVGARLRPISELAGARVGSQVAVAVGGGYDILPRELLSAMVEVRALPGFAEQSTTQENPNGLVSTPNGRIIAPAEWAVSVRSAPLRGGDFAIQLAGGGPIPFSSESAITNPRFRFSLGIRYEPVARDSDHDGILDKDDACPGIKGVKGGKGGDGCPPSLEHERLDLSGPASTSPPAPPAPDQAPVEPNR
jgi:hypothetical protein